MKGISVALLLVGITLPLFAGPSFKVEPPEFEWGRQAENKGMYDFSFVLSNEGDAPLKIENVRPGCGCTKVNVPKHDLAPGEKVTMTGTLKTERVEGRMRKGIIITTNDPKRKITIARLCIAFPYNAEGIRIRSKRYAARFRNNNLYAYISVENCEAETTHHIQGAELPAGWSINKELPLELGPEERKIVVLRRPLEEGKEPEPFEELPFTFITDCIKTPELTAGLIYRPPKKPIVKPATAANTKIDHGQITKPAAPQKANDKTRQAEPKTEKTADKQTQQKKTEKPAETQ